MNKKIDKVILIVTILAQIPSTYHPTHAQVDENLKLFASGFLSQVCSQTQTFFQAHKLASFHIKAGFFSHPKLVAAYL